MKIICIGDSLTRGYGVSNKENWVELLNKDEVGEFINKGINGDTTGGMLSRFQRDVIDEAPDYTVIMGGVNDMIAGSCLGSIQSNMMAMVHQAYSRGIIPIIGISISPDAATFRKDWAELTSVGVLQNSVKEYRNWLIHFCGIFKIAYIDFHTEFDYRIRGNYNSYLLDGLHPTKESHRVLADIAYQAIFLKLKREGETDKWRNKGDME